MAEQIQEVGIGTLVKVNLTVQPIDGIAFSGMNWECVFSGDKSSISVSKEEAVAVDANTYTCYVDTTGTGAGALKAQLRVEIPDSYAPNGIRPEVTPPFSINIKVV